ncbi:MAG: efflux RND transporter periplasmic adaptor subunit [Lachnospiraceae bacterium]|nr:efflux RND transporter periplasmic adaptor subunit [Lachnospiraceae bacterium]
MSLTEIENRLDEITAQTDALNAKIEEKTARMQRTLTDLQKTTMDVDQNNISDSTDASQGNTAPVDRKTDEEKAKQMTLALQESISEVQYALSYDPEILSWKKQINDLAEEKTRLTEAASAENARMTSGDKEALEAQRSLSALDTQATIADVEEASSGISAEFNGVVTELNVHPGETVAKGAKLITIASTDEVQIDMQISKGDIGRIKEGQSVDITIAGNSYTGKVSHISGTATKNANGVPMVAAIVTIDDPDDTIILGTEAALKIHTDKAENVPVVPYEFIGADTDGDYVYTIGEDSRAVRVDVTIGLSTGTMAQITEGLAAGDVMITEDPEMISEGMLLVETEAVE